MTRVHLEESTVEIGQKMTEKNPIFKNRCCGFSVEKALD
jgi:hypothetical protein